MSTDPYQAFDKAKWHDGSIQEYGLGEDQSFVHTGLFVAWCALNGLWNPEHRDPAMIEAMRRREAPPIALYEWNDGCFFPFMLAPEGEAFARRYFVFQTGEYIKDYIATLARDLPSEFHVPNDWASYDRIAPVIARRFAEFRKGKPRFWSLDRKP